MAKFINFKVTGGFDFAGTPLSAPATDGDNLLDADSILSVAVNATTFIATIQLKGTNLTNDRCRVAFGTDATATYIGNLPTVVTAAQIKEAINKAITANPGGVKATVSLPLDQASDAAYDFSKTIYIKGFLVD